MRSVAACLVALLAGTAPGWAGPSLLLPSAPSSIPTPPAAPPNRPIDLSAFGAFHNMAQRQAEPFIRHDTDDAMPTGNSGLSLGPLQTDFQRATGKHAQFARFRLNGVTVFGAAIGGSIDGRSAHLVLSWPTSP